MIVCKELNKSFETKEELFSSLREYRKDIINQKKSEIYESFKKGQGVSLGKTDITKLSTVKNEFKDDNYHYIVVNTTGVLDSHGDLHKRGLWNKSAKEQNRKNSLVDTHNMSLKTTAVRRQNVEIFLADIPFSLVGKNYGGDTQALVYKVPKDKVINGYSEWLNEGTDIEGSVKMQYVDIELAMNSKNEEDKTEKKRYDDNIDSIANKSEYEDITHFWVVNQAKNIGESSLVQNGSNSATGLIEPSVDTQQTKDTRAEPSIYETIKNNFKLN